MVSTVIGRHHSILRRRGPPLCEALPSPQSSTTTTLMTATVGGGDTDEDRGDGDVRFESSVFQ
jgi:hypothetical protein